MKKPILFVFALIPLLASCNGSENGFVNPFPNDPYAEKKIGFNFAENEKIKRVLTTQESELLDKTLNLSNLDYINEYLLKQETGEIHERDYKRAFAGVHGEGYTSSNMMYDETFKSFYQEADADSELNERRKTMSEVTSTYDYAYGQNTTKTTIKTLRYLAEKKENLPIYAENANGEFAIERKYEVVDPQHSDKDVDISASIVAITQFDSKRALHLNQSDYVFKPSASDPIAGAYDDNHIIIIREQHDPSGEYKLPDGRAYMIAKNSLRVTCLAKAEDDTDGGIGDYYLVEHSRVYTETAITSDVIHPNVPITFLKNPIVINYKEEIHKFLTATSKDKSKEEINEVEIR